MRHSKIKDNKKLLHKGRQIGKYRLLRRLGEGAYGDVWKAYDTIERVHVALKIRAIPVTNSERNAIQHEVSMLMRLDHPNIVRIKNAHIIENWIIIATEMDGSQGVLWLQPSCLSLQAQAMNMNCSAMSMGQH